MEIIAKTSGTGVLINATEQEVKEILNAVMGKSPDKIEIGQKIPAIDYASTIRKIQSLEKDYVFTNLVDYGRRFNESIEQLKQSVVKASQIQI